MVEAAMAKAKNVWHSEEWQCRDRLARTVDIPAEVGVETERILLKDVFDRRVWFPEGGIYILRDGDRVMYVGLTDRPIRWRLKSAIVIGKTWTRAGGYETWTVTLQRPPEWPDDRKRELALIAQLDPPFNIMGRPRKPREKTPRCACVGACPTCGLPRVPRGQPKNGSFA